MQPVCIFRRYWRPRQQQQTIKFLSNNYHWNQFTHGSRFDADEVHTVSELRAFPLEARFAGNLAIQECRNNLSHRIHHTNLHIFFLFQRKFDVDHICRRIREAAQAAVFDRTAAAAFNNICRTKRAVIFKEISAALIEARTEVVFVCADAGIRAINRYAAAKVVVGRDGRTQQFVDLSPAAAFREDIRRTGVRKHVIIKLRTDNHGAAINIHTKTELVGNKSV